MHRPWRDFCVCRRTFTPSAAERTYSRAFRNATPFFLGLFVSPFATPSLLLYQALFSTLLVPGSLEAETRRESAASPSEPSPSDAPGAEFLRLRLRQDTDPDNGPILAPSIWKLDFAKFEVFELFSSSAVAALLCTTRFEHVMVFQRSQYLSDSIDLIDCTKFLELFCNGRNLY